MIDEELQITTTAFFLQRNWRKGGKEEKRKRGKKGKMDTAHKHGTVPIQLRNFIIDKFIQLHIKQPLVQLSPCEHVFITESRQTRSADEMSNLYKQCITCGYCPTVA